MVLPSRKRHTKQPTELPKEFLHTVSDLFKKQFKKDLSGESFLVYGALHADEVVLAISLSHPKTLRSASMHVSADLTGDAAAKPEKVTEQLKGMVDVAASWFAQCFQAGKGLDAVLDEMTDLDPSWQEFEWEGTTLWVKINKDNYALEHAADDLLRKAGFDPEDDEDEELEKILNGEDDEDDGIKAGTELARVQNRNARVPGSGKRALLFQRESSSLPRPGSCPETPASPSA